MKDWKHTCTRVATILAGFAVLGFVGCGPMDDDGNGDGDGDGNGGDETTTFTVRIDNTAPGDFYGSETATGGAIWITPGTYAIHSGDNPVYTEGESASSGLEAIAEAGKVGGTEENDSLESVLSGMENVMSVGSWKPGDTVEDPNDPKGEVPGAPPIAPGGAYEFEVTAEPGAKMSFATMYVPSNDIFFAPDSDGIALFSDGSPVEGDVTDQIGLYDAGTEVNQEPGVGAEGAPKQAMNGGADAGEDEDKNVRPLGSVDDGFEYVGSAGDAIEVTITPNDG